MPCKKIPCPKCGGLMRSTAAMCRACHVVKGHGAYRTLEYQSWRAMWARCTNPDHQAYRNYGGRGITICEQWSDVKVFMADMGPRLGREYSLDRIDNDGNYEPGNCRWATAHEQCLTRRSARWITHEGETMLMIDWARRLGLSPATLCDRLKAGWPVERALTPARSYVPGRHGSAPDPDDMR